MTPRLADSASGFSTHGNATPRAARNGSSLRAMRRNRGIGTPAAARHWRIWYLSRAAATAATALARSPSRPRVAGGGVEGQEMVGGLCLERARLLGGANHVEAQRPRGVEERLGAIRRRRQEQQQPVHRGGACRRRPG